MEPNQLSPPEIKNKIISILRIKGPSLPVQIASKIGINSIFAGAYLSELAAEKTIKISKMKVGGSPLYFLPGQEIQLENSHNYLQSKEKQAFILLRENKILLDSEQEPAIRVALRNLKDFAFPVTLSQENQQTLYWYFHSIPQEEVKRLLEKPQSRIQSKPTPKSTPPKQKLTIKPQQKPVQIKKEVEKPLLELKPAEKPRKVKEKSDFANSVIQIIKAEDIEILEEKEVKKKEFSAIIRINSDIGKLCFLLIAKDKKKVTENDFSLAVQKSQVEKMPVFFMSSGQPNKKAQKYLENYSSLIKFRQV